MPQSEAKTKTHSTNMKTNLKIAAVAAFFALGLSAYAQSGFIRPELSLVMPTTKAGQFDAKLKSTVGYGIAGGVVFGAQDEQEIGVSISLADVKGSTSTSTPFNYYGTNYNTGSDSFKVKTMPVLLNYRYYFGAKADGTRFYFGPSIGYTHLKYTETAVGNRPGFVDTITINDSKNGFTWAMALGFAVKLADKTDLDVGYRFTSAKAWDGHYNAGALYTGITFKF
jgi:outer membrane protein W